MKSPRQLARARLRISIVSAQGLRAADLSLFGGAKSDPYCICEISGHPEQTIKTEPVRKTLDPEWNYEGVIEQCKAGESLVFSVYDHDVITPDDHLGKATLEWDHFFPNGYHGTLALEGHGHKKGKDKPTLMVIVETFPIEQGEDDKPRLYVTVEGARGLRSADFMGKSDPYCVCCVPSKPRSKFRTKVIMDSVDPAWNEEDELPDYEVGDDIEFIIYDWDRTSADDELGRATLSAESFTPDGFRGPLTLAKGKLNVKVELYVPEPLEPVDPGAHVGPDDRRPAPFQLNSMDTGRVHRLAAYTVVGRSKRQLDPRYDLCLDTPGIGDVSRVNHAVIKAWCGADPSSWVVRVYSDQAGRGVGFGAGGGHLGGGTSVDNVPVDTKLGTSLEPGSVLRFGVREMWVLERAVVYRKSQVGEIACQRARTNATEDPGSFRELRVPSGACQHALQHCGDWDSLVRVVLEWCGEPDEAPCVDVIEALDETGKLVGRHEARTLEEQEAYKVGSILREVRMGCAIRIRLSSDPCLLAPILGKLEKDLKRMEDTHLSRSEALFGGLGS